MDLRILKYFLTIIEEGSMVKAADALYITQPTLSRQIAKLERDLDVTLFDRESHKLTLTEDGKLLQRRAEEILSLVDITYDDLSHKNDSINGHITISGGEIGTFKDIVDIIEHFHQDYPDATFSIVTNTSENVADNLEKGLVDIGVLLEPIDVSHFNFIRLTNKEEWIVVMNPDDPLLSKESITAQDLLDKPLVLPIRVNVRNEVTNWLGSTLSKQKILATSNLNTNGTLFVLNNIARYILIDKNTGLINNQCLMSRPLNPPLKATSIIAWKKDTLSPTINKFIEYIQDYYHKKD